MGIHVRMDSDLNEMLQSIMENEVVLTPISNAMISKVESVNLHLILT